MKDNQIFVMDFIELEPVSTSQEFPEQSYQESDGNGLLLAFTASAFMALTVTFVGRILQHRNYKKKKSKFIQFKPSCATPCMNCRFFHNKSSQKCAIHPSRVLKQEAVNCSDYWGQDSSEFSRR